MISEEELKNKIDTLCKDSEKLEQIKESIYKGVRKQYPEIQELYKAEKFKTDDFSKVFTSFYQIRNRGDLDIPVLLQIIAERQEKKIGDVIEKIADSKNKKL